MIDFHLSIIENYGSDVLDDPNMEYLRKYWMNISQLKADWAELLDQKFVLGQDCFAVSTRCDAESHLGGAIFAEEEFSEFKRMSADMGAKSFAIVEYIGQDQWNEFESISFFRFVFPLDIAWAEMVCSCSIAYDVFERPIRTYFVLSDNGCVGKYVDSDALHPYDLRFPVAREG
ncbi:hypothetical protein ABRP17_013895 [Stenotrophomonas sp. WHRI 8082]|uniref:hypothetical protein n=1 Tax=Stenotrophomonas sp. WHRI 8082 TaxID=3162571 RepID=UPI0032ED5581